MLHLSVCLPTISRWRKQCVHVATRFLGLQTGCCLRPASGTEAWSNLQSESCACRQAADGVAESLHLPKVPLKAFALARIVHNCEIHQLRIIVHVSHAHIPLNCIRIDHITTLYSI